MREKHSRETSLRILAIVSLVFLSMIFVATILFVNRRVEYREQHIAMDGYLPLMNASVNEEPVYLNGWWDVFEGVVCATENDVRDLGETQEKARFPIGAITQAQKDATYRLRFSLTNGTMDGLVLYIPTLGKNADIYLNGIKQNYIQDGTPWLKYSTIESVIPLTDFSPEQEWQELVITKKFSDSELTLYKRPVMIGTMKNISALAIFSSSNEMFLVGLLMLVLVNGYVFMAFRPSHKVISLMTLFDTMILLRSVLPMNHVIAFAKGVFPQMHISDRFCASAALFFLMMGGIIGCMLSGELYDPKKKAPRWLIVPAPFLYAIFAIIFPLSPEFFEKYGKIMLIATYVITFVGVFVQYKISWDSGERQIYNSLQFIKTMFIGGLIFIDILLWNTSTDFLLIFYLYTTFFILHVVVRLYDNNESYREVEVLNQSLEQTVEQRTRELSEANRILAELSIKDPLTQIFNRLYFEQTIEQVMRVSNKDTSLHLCIFDLDLFKMINDTYGHGAGDEQLKSMAVLVSEIIKEKAVFARFGGEEFVLLFQDEARSQVLDCIRCVHRAIADDAQQNEKHTTASFGVASLETGDTEKKLMKRADIALYEAKRLGRNCIATNFDQILCLLPDNQEE